MLLFSSTAGEVTEETVIQEIHRFRASDDVFCTDFLSSTIIIQSKTPLAQSLKPDQLPLLRAQLSWDVRTVFTLPLFTDGTALPSGPYFIHRGHVCEAWKLYADELSSFQTTVVPDADDPYG